jgi:hypothetical protein
MVITHANMAITLRPMAEEAAKSAGVIMFSSVLHVDPILEQV